MKEWDEREKVFEFIKNMMDIVTPVLNEFFGGKYLSDEEKEKLK